MRTTWLHQLLAASAMVLAAQSHAECVGNDTSKWSASSASEARQCLTKLKLTFEIKNCDLEVCRKVIDWRAKPSEARAPEALPMLDLIKANLQTSAGSFAKTADLTLKMTAFIEQLKAASPEILADPFRDPFRQAQNRRWAYDPVAGLLAEEDAASAAAAAAGIDLGAALAQSCGAPLDQARCDNAIRASGAMVLHATLYQTMVTWLIQDDRIAFARYVEEIRTRWATYFDKSRVQFPWELWLNSWRFQRELNQRRSKQEPTGYGLTSPPEDQWILLHPSVGLRYGGAPDRKLDQTVVLELAGYYRWEWSGATAKNLVGGSLIATWTNSGAAQNKGYGFMVHMPKNYSIGLIQERGAGRNRLGLVVSIDLGKLIQDPEAAKRSLLGL